MEFDAEAVGQAVECPHCGQSTVLLLPTENPPLQTTEPPASVEQPKESNLVACPDCGKMVSRLTKACPQCGSPIKGRISDNRYRGAAKASMVSGILSLILIPLFPVFFLVVVTVGVKLLSWISGIQALFNAIEEHAFLLLLLVFVTVIPAIIWGHKALKLARQVPEHYTGRGMAIAGLIMGYLSIPLILGLIAKGQIDSTNRKLTMAKFKRQSCENNLKLIGLSFAQWSLDHGDKFPFNVSTASGGSQEFCDRGNDGYDRNAFIHFQIMSNELIYPSCLICISDSGHQKAADFQHFSRSNVTYQVRSGANVDALNPDEILACCPIHKLTLRVNHEVNRFYTPSVKVPGTHVRD